MNQYGVAALGKDLSFPAACALSWIIRLALKRLISPWRRT